MSVTLTVQIDGIGAVSPVELLDLQVEATFINESQTGDIVSSVQPNITIEKFTFVNEDASRIQQWISDGVTLAGAGIFEGVPFTIIGNDETNTQTLFEGVLDLTDDYREINPTKVQAKVKKIQGLNTFDERTQAVTYGFLNSLDPSLPGAIPDSTFASVPYVVERKLEPLKLMMSAVVVFLMAKELAEAAEKLAEALQNVLAIATGGNPITGLPSSLVLAIGLALIRAAYFAIIIIAIIKLIRELVSQLISPVRFHKMLKWKVALQKGAEYLGFGFESPISELDFMFYLPSKPDEEEPLPNGIPRPDDFGYKVDEMFDLAKRAFNAKIAILDNVVILRSLNDPFWDKNSTYTMPDILLESKTFNTNEFFANRLIQFETDPIDLWTVNDFEGTNYEVITTAIKTTNDKNTLLKGLDLIQLPVALPTRKDGLSLVESVIKVTASIADGVINLFGGNSSLASLITTRIGMLKLSDNVHTVPKLVPLINNRIPANHRTGLWKAKILYDKYHNERSFVDNDFGGQYELFTDEKVPFGFCNFIELIENNQFTTNDNRLGKVDSIRWTMGEDSALLDFRIQEPYTKNLKETTIETA